jgi:hypothetical protein
MNPIYEDTDAFYQYFVLYFVCPTSPLRLIYILAISLLFIPDTFFANPVAQFPPAMAPQQLARRQVKILNGVYDPLSRLWLLIMVQIL